MMSDEGTRTERRRKRDDGIGETRMRVEDEVMRTNLVSNDNY